ncbi:MAG: shikimate dehydrogenase [Desulfonatronovibrionaceae bacterium]
MDCCIYGITGYPLGHSLSPALHNHWFAECGSQNKVYCTWPVKNEDLDYFIRSVRLLSISGASVTIPHKEAVIPFLDEISPTARQIGAVNTLYWRKGRLAGDNTDVTGFTLPLLSLKKDLHSALVLGAGGAARAVVHGLKKLGIKTVLSNKTASKAEALAREMKAETVAWEKRHSVRTDLLVNTTPLGMYGENRDRSPWEADMTGVQAVYDIIYNPVDTPLTKQATQEGKTIIPGLEMFVAQAAEQFRIWTGLEMDREPALAFLGRILGKSRAG